MFPRDYNATAPKRPTRTTMRPYKTTRRGWVSAKTAGRRPSSSHSASLFLATPRFAAIRVFRVDHLAALRPSADLFRYDRATSPRALRAAGHSGARGGSAVAAL